MDWQTNPTLNSQLIQTFPFSFPLFSYCEYYSQNNVAFLFGTQTSIKHSFAKFLHFKMKFWDPKSNSHISQLVRKIISCQYYLGFWLKIVFWWKSRILSPVPSNQSRPWCCWQNKKSWAPYFNVNFCGIFSSSFNSHVVQTKSCISSLCVLPSFLCSFHLFASTRKPLLCHWQTPAAPLSRLMQRVYINIAATFTFHCVEEFLVFSFYKYRNSCVECLFEVALIMCMITL